MYPHDRTVQICGIAISTGEGDILAGMKSLLPQPEIVTRNGKPVAVIVPIAVYQELLERAEDAEDVAWLRRARRKPLRYRPLEDYMAARKAKGRV